MIVFLLAAAAPAACLGPPVLMVVAGPTHDRARMIAYGKAIADSGLYRKLGGYYLNVPRALATFEGRAPSGHTTLIVRFPCLANAQAFWNSREYQERIKPLRLNPSAGDYLVTVYPEAQLSPDMVGKVGDNAYRGTFPAAGIPQVPPDSAKSVETLSVRRSPIAPSPRPAARRGSTRAR